MTDRMRVYIGWDKREPDAYAVARYSLQRRTSALADVLPLVVDDLRSTGLFTRPVEMRGNQLWDTISDAPQSTEFATTRFLVPHLAGRGWALFTDCDVLFLDDIARLFGVADPRFAVMVVKHLHEPVEATKMDGQIQTSYRRKNWSSVMLFNCDHPANRERLTPAFVNSVPGRDLHAFCWLEDDLVGALDPRWNWLVDVQPRPERVGIAHFTLGGPWLPDWQPRETDAMWSAEREIMRADLAGPPAPLGPVV